MAARDIEGRPRLSHSVETTFVAEMKLETTSAAAVQPVRGCGSVALLWECGDVPMGVEFTRGMRACAKARNRLRLLAS